MSDLSFCSIKLDSQLNFSVLSALTAATLRYVEDELDMAEGDRRGEYWRDYHFEPFDRPIPPGESHWRAQELQAKLDLLEMLLLGLRPNWIPPAWFPSSLPPPVLPPRNEELCSFSAVPNPSLRSCDRVGVEGSSTVPNNSGPQQSGHGRGSRRRRHGALAASGEGSSASGVRPEGGYGEDVGLQGSDSGIAGSSSGRGLRPRSSLRAPKTSDGTARLRPSYRY